jgi:hypothetical protein
MTLNFESDSVRKLSLDGPLIHLPKDSSLVVIYHNDGTGKSGLIQSQFSDESFKTLCEERILSTKQGLLQRSIPD